MQSMIPWTVGQREKEAESRETETEKQAYLFAAACNPVVRVES